MVPPRTLSEAIDKLDCAAHEIQVLASENRILREEIATLKKGLFGRRSERFESPQPGLFGEDAVPEPESRKEGSQPKAKNEGKKGHGRAAFSKELPREDIELDVLEEDRCCPECDSQMQLIGEEVCERGHMVPARVVVRRYLKKKYACPNGHGVITASAPAGVVDKGKYEASVYAHLVTSKYADHLPLHRLEGIFKRHGLTLPKQTMWGMLRTVSEVLARPILAQMRLELLQEAVLHADETPITMRLEGAKGTRTSYAWGWRNLRGAEPSKVVIDFRPSRGRDGPKAFLGKWKGTMIADGYPGYDEVVERNGITRAGCMAHARRKVKEALDLGSRDAELVFLPIQRLFWIERAMRKRVEKKKLSWEDLVALRRDVRERLSRRVSSRLLDMIETLKRKPSTLPKSKLGKALGYLENQWKPLTVFLADPRIPMHNNDSERDLRHLAVGRNNWMVFGSPRGGEVACQLYSLVLSCKQCGVDPEAYIEDVLGRIDTTPHSKIRELTPWGWKAARQREVASS